MGLRAKAGRMHSSLGYKSPTQFERECTTKLIDAANDDPHKGNDSQGAMLNKRAAKSLDEKWTGSACGGMLTPYTLLYILA